VKNRRNRYLLVRIDCSESFDSKQLMDVIWSAVLRLFGEYGASKCGLALIDFDAEKKLAVLRVAHKEVGTIRAALASIVKINEKPAALHVQSVSGTIKALHKKKQSNKKFKLV